MLQFYANDNYLTKVTSSNCYCYTNYRTFLNIHNINYYEFANLLHLKKNEIFSSTVSENASMFMYQIPGSYLTEILPNSIPVGWSTRIIDLSFNELTEIHAGAFTIISQPGNMMSNFIVCIIISKIHIL